MKAKSREEIAHSIGYSPKQLKRKLKEKDVTLPKGLVYPAWQKVIYIVTFYPDETTRKEFEQVELPPEFG